MRIAVLGAGVAGMATAIVLKQRGHVVQIYERRPAQSSLGAGVVLWPNASFVLDELGLLSRIATVGGRPLSMQRFSETGEPLGQLDIRDLDQKMGFPSFAILRRDLQQILSDRARQLDVPIRYGHQAVNILQEQDGYAQVAFAHHDPIQAELVIGADGRMNSCARRYVLGHNTPVLQGVVTWIGTLTAPTALVEDIAIRDFWGVGKRFGIVAINQSTLYWAGAIGVEAPSPAGHADLKAELTAQFAEWPEMVQQVIARSEPHHIRKIDLYDHDPATIWHRNRVLMIGDAAHASLPTSGQGASQALEDAWHLGQCFPDDGMDLESALTAFTERRQSKTGFMTQFARDFSSSLFNPDADACRLRNEQARSANLQQAVAAMAEGWGATLPLRP